LNRVKTALAKQKLKTLPPGFEHRSKTLQPNSPRQFHQKQQKKPGHVL